MDLSKLGVPPRDYRELIEKLRDPEQWQSLTPTERATLADLAERKLSLPDGQPASTDARLTRRMMAQELVTLTALYGRGGYESALRDVAEAFGVPPAKVKEATKETRRQMGATNWNHWKKRQQELIAKVKAEHE